MSDFASDVAGGSCRGWTASVRLAPAEVQRILSGYLADHLEAALVNDSTYAQRLAECEICPDLMYQGTTCRHCGCLVAVRAKLAGKGCPGSSPRWEPQHCPATAQRLERQ